MNAYEAAMIPLDIIGGLALCHWIGDYCFQTRYMARNKHKDLYALTTHVVVYSTFFLGFGIEFAMWAGVAHWLTDVWTSKLVHFAWAEKDTNASPLFYEWFTFFIMGLDQLIHILSLVLIWNFLNVS
jgi:hypothetical protein